MEEEKKFSLIDYLEIAWRRKWYIIVPFVMVMCVSLTLCLVLPKIYRASTTILIIPQEVPDSFVKSTVTMNPSEYLKVIYQEVMSRSRLEKIIAELSLFPDVAPHTPIEKLVDRMRNNITIEIHSRAEQGRGPSSFTISYLDRDPHTAAATANRLASLFIEENVRSREQQAKQTTRFISEELQKLGVTLEVQEKKISDFKQRYLGSLPEQREANLRMLEQLILQRQRITDELNDAENRKIMLQQLLQSEGTIPLAGNTMRTVPPTSLQSRVNDVRRRLAELQRKYTDNHPDVIATRSELDKLLAQVHTSPGEEEVPPVAPTPQSDLERQILALNLDVKKLKSEDALLKAKIDEYQSKVEMAPKLEQQLASLTRDYENTKNAYDDLMKKRMAAEQAEKMEINRQGEQFKILDRAQVPLTPFKPNRLKILMMGFIIALGLGGGLTVLVEYLDQSFYNVRDLESYLELPVLASIPLVTKPEQKKWVIKPRPVVARTHPS